LYRKIVLTPFLSLGKHKKALHQRMAKQRLMYIEKKTGHSDNGPAWICNVSFSKSGTTIYFNGKALIRMHGGGRSGNYLDIESRDEYWISGVKKKSNNRHWAGSGKISVDVKSLDDFLNHTGQDKLDTNQFEICKDIIETDPTQFYELENRKL
jgi:hypothetical protein